MTHRHDAALETFEGRIGSRIAFFPACTSTNAVAHDLALAGAPDGQVVLADAQTAGRGRLDRSWQSPPGANLYASVILRPPIAPVEAPQITLMAGVAVASLLDAFCPGKVRIKWPNDVLLQDRKICGILTEMKAGAARVDFVVLGIGLNVNLAREDFDPALRTIATSLREETGSLHDRVTVLTRLFSHLQTWYDLFLKVRFRGVRDAWLAHADIVGRPIRVVFRDEVTEGEALGIDDDGTLLMRDASGRTVRVTAGDVLMLTGGKP